MSLYEEEIEGLDKAVNKYISDHPDEELTPEIMKSIIDAVDCGVTKKLENMCKYIARLQFDIDYADFEINRAKEFKERVYKRINGLKGYLLPYILENGKTTAGTFTLSNRKSSRVVILDEEVIDDEFKRTETQVKIDKALIKKYLTDSNLLEMCGAEIVENNNLQIK